MVEEAIVTHVMEEDTFPPIVLRVNTGPVDPLFALALLVDTRVGCPSPFEGLELELLFVDALLGGGLTISG
ncbi:hypothetical protein A2U01_0000658, partial [Trifolium medium]|nr:hypothetical protein [Trifolium medium]